MRISSVSWSSLLLATEWLTRGCPHEQEDTGRRRYRFYLPDVAEWLGLDGVSGDDEPPELTKERAFLAKAQCAKTEVETDLRKAQLGQVLAGGSIPANAARELFAHGEILFLQN